MKRPHAVLKLIANAGMSVALLCGCANKGPASAGPADEQTVRSIRQALTAADPNVVVGMVTYVLDTDDFALVADIPVDRFQMNDAITFIDSRSEPIANGVVAAVKADALHVKIVNTLVPGRKVSKGDLAVRFKQ